LLLPLVCQAAESVEERKARLVQAALASIPEGGAERTLSPYFFVLAEGSQAEALPLEGVQARVSIAGMIAHVRLTQTYRNRGDQDLEAIYLFPASTRAAVHAMRMTVGERVIEAKVQKRAEARETYERALAEGRTASLLEQQRPNVFQMSVGHILPGDQVRVELEYTELLVPEEGQYEFVLPSVVGPRYSNQPAAGAADSERWVENPYLHAGEPPPYTWEALVELQSGLPIAAVTSPSHPVRVEYSDPRKACVEILDTAAGNRDLVVRYRLAGDEIEQGLLLFPGAGPEDEGFFALAVEPPARVERTALVPREYLFVLDVSGSMHGFPLDTAKSLMEKLFQGMRSDERFNILTFSGGDAVFAAAPQEATRKNVKRALAWLDRFDGGGGTELLPALQHALAMPRAEGMSRIMVVVTDGYVAVEKQAFELVAARLGEANLFAFGIGSSVNRFLIEGLARAGQGEPFVVLGPREVEAKARRFVELVSQPVLQGIRVSFEGLETHDLEPAAVPDLFARRPVLVVGKYHGPAQGRIRVTGHSAAGPFEQSLEVSEAQASDELSALRYLWARGRIARLSDLQRLEPGGEGEAQVTELGLRYNLLTDFTSFVAVDTEVRADGQKVTQVRQPLPLPEGVEDSAVGNQGVLGCLSGSATGSSVGYGGLGLMGRGQGGGGARLGRRSASPSVGMSSPMITGSLDRSVVQRVIRAQQPRIKLLYERRLKATPGLAGKIVLRFTIAADGKVKKVEIAEDTVGDETLARELRALAATWVFPAVKGGGEVVVNYPFVFSTAGP